MIDQTEPIVYKLKEMYAKCGKTYKEIGQMVGLPELVVKRIINGVTQRPYITDVSNIWKAMTGKTTTADLYDENVKVDIVAETPQVVVPTVDANVYNQMIQMYKDIIATKDESFNKIIKQKDRWIKLLFALLFFFMLLAAIFIGIDLASGEFGLFRY